VTKKSNINTDKLLWLGVVLLFLALIAFVYVLFNRSKNPIPTGKTYFDQFTYVSDDDLLGEDGKKDLLEALKFQKVHTLYQASYVELVDKINNLDTSKINIRNAQGIFDDYNNVKREYTRTLKRIDEYEKEYKLKCFARMRSLILAVLYSDKHFKKRTTKFDPEVFIEIGALQEIPVCPRGGEYSIVYKDGRRLFRCSKHGILKN
jgi:hypothetical protein